MSDIMRNNVEKLGWNKIKKTLNPISILDFDHSIYPFIAIQWSPFFCVTSHFINQSSSVMITGERRK